MHWTPEANTELLKQVLKIHDVKLDFSALAAAMGSDCTPKAVKSHINRVRASTNAANGASGNTSTSPTSPVTKTKPKTSQTKKPSRKRGASVLNGTSEAEEETKAMPSKKVKVETVESEKDPANEKDNEESKGDGE